MRNPSFLWMVVGIMVLLDFYVFQAIRAVLPPSMPKLRLAISVIYWVIAVVVLITMAAFPFIDFASWPKQLRTYVFALIVAVFFSQLVASLFFLVDDIRRGATWTILKLFRNSNATEGGDPISRSAFLSWLGLVMGGSLFGSLIYGFSNKYNYHIRRVNLSFQNLPPSFKGLRIVQMSDIHSGSFNNKKAVKKGVEMILKERADLILFTGDLVNDRATEMMDYDGYIQQAESADGCVFNTGQS